MIVLAAFWLGLSGSLHCATMCGGLSASLVELGRSERDAKAQRARAWLLTHFGRTLAYAALGVVGAWIGRPWLGDALGERLRALVLLLGGVVLLLVAIGLIARRGGLVASGGWLTRAFGAFARRVLRSRRGPLVGGLVWGFVPCGLVYAAGLLAVGTAHPGWALATMLAFVLGTLPMHGALGFFGARAWQALREPATRYALAAALMVFAVVQIHHARHAWRAADADRAPVTLSP